MDDLPPWLKERLPHVHEIAKAIEQKRADDAAAKEKAEREANNRGR